LRTQTCVLTGQRGDDHNSVIPMHIGTAGKGLKSPDDEALPVMHSLHRSGHNHGEVSMLRKNAPDWLIREAFRAYARQLYQEWKNEQA
jgi:hypothetical protein